MNNLIFIIILTYKSRRWIDNCLNSVLKTRYPNFRVLIIDNASKDGSVKCVEKILSRI